MSSIAIPAPLRHVYIYEIVGQHPKAVPSISLTDRGKVGGKVGRTSRLSVPRRQNGYWQDDPSCFTELTLTRWVTAPAVLLWPLLVEPLIEPLSEPLCVEPLVDPVVPAVPDVLPVVPDVVPL